MDIKTLMTTGFVKALVSDQFSYDYVVIGSDGAGEQCE